MNKSEAKEIAKEMLRDAVADAYNALENCSYSKEDEEQIFEYIKKYGITMCKSINKEYITY